MKVLASVAVVASVSGGGARMDACPSSTDFIVSLVSVTDTHGGGGGGNVVMCNVGVELFVVEIKCC